MKLLKVFGVVVAVSALAGCVTAKQSYLDDGYRPISGEEILEIFGGKTVEGRYTNGSGSYIDYRAPDGRLATIDRRGKLYHGTWAIDGDLLCFTYPTGGDPTPRCVDVLEKDGQYAEFRVDGPTLGKYGAEITDIQPGNAKNLPLE